MTAGRTQVLSVHRLRAVARLRERELQARLDAIRAGQPAAAYSSDYRTWAQGVRVEPVAASQGKPWPKGTPARVRNRTQFAVVATEQPGR